MTVGTRLRMSGPSAPAPGVETFTGANGSPVPMPWLRHSNGNAAPTIQSDMLRLTSAGVYQGNTVTYGTGTWTDLDVTCTVKINGTVQEQYPGIGYRMSGGIYGWEEPGGEPYAGYACWLNVQGNQVVFAPFTGGTQGTATTAAFVFAGGTSYRIRVQVIGSAHKFAIWTVGGSQAGWQIEVTDATHSSGTWGFRDQVSFAGVISEWDDFTWLPATGTAGYAGPHFLTTGAVGGSSGTSLSVAWPVGYKVGDVALLLCESVGAETIALSTAAGFVEVANSPSATGTALLGTKLAVFWRRATGLGMGAPTIAFPGNHILGQMLIFSGCVGAGDPWDVTVAAQKPAASTAMSLPAVTTTGTDRLVVVIAARDTDSSAAAASAWANANLENLFERTDLGNIVGNGGGLMVAAGWKRTAGDTGATTATVASSINSYLTIALKAA